MDVLKVRHSMALLSFRALVCFTLVASYTLVVRFGERRLLFYVDDLALRWQGVANVVRFGDQCGVGYVVVCALVAVDLMSRFERIRALWCRLIAAVSE